MEKDDKKANDALQALVVLKSIFIIIAIFGVLLALLEIDLYYSEARNGLVLSSTARRFVNRTVIKDNYDGDISTNYSIAFFSKSSMEGQQVSYSHWLGIAMIKNEIVYDLVIPVVLIFIGIYGFLSSIRRERVIKK